MTINFMLPRKKDVELQHDRGVYGIAGGISCGLPGGVSGMSGGISGDVAGGCSGICGGISGGVVGISGGDPGV